MSEHEHAPAVKSQTSADRPKSSPSSRKDDKLMFVYVVDHHRIDDDHVEVSLNTRKHPVAVGMTGVVLGLPGAKVEVHRVFAGGAKARISLPGIAREIKHHAQFALETSDSLAASNAANGHFPHDRAGRAKYLATKGK